VTAELRPGARVGRYRLLERIGAGGMAEVFAARTEGAEGFARTVAIKVVHSVADEENILALIDEARVASWLRHPNVVQVIELHRHGDGLYMVMEYLEGWGLDRVLKTASSSGARASLQAVVALGLQVCEALEYAHSARSDDGVPLKLVHRDIKPSNLMLDPRGHVKVVDFGIAKAVGLERRTATGVGKGTPAYMSPEQLYGREVSPSSDLFALGCVLFELATGERLFDADAFGPLIMRRQEGFTPADRARLDAACPELADVIEKAVSQQPEDRFPDAASMAAALRAAGGADVRAPLKEWMTEAFGADLTTLTRKVVDPAGDTAPGPPIGVAATEQLPVAPPTPEVGATRLMPPPARRQGRGWVAMIGGLLLLGVGLIAFWPEPTPIAVRTEPLPEPVTEPEPTPEATPALALELPEPTPPREPTPAPEPVTRAPEPTPEPPTVAVAEPVSARGTVHFTLLPSGTVEVVGQGSSVTPAKMRLPPGEHGVRLLDKEGGVLATTRIRVESGGTSRCTWELVSGQMELLVDPAGTDPCVLLP